MKAVLCIIDRSSFYSIGSDTSHRSVDIAMLNLHGSRWAPPSFRAQAHSPSRGRPVSDASRTPQHPTSSSPHQHPSPNKLTPSQRHILTRQTEHQRFLCLFRRLRWKSHMLLFSHHRALSQTTSTTINGVSWTIERGEAETMFRVDFFEWYVLLERCLICILASVGVNVSASYNPKNGIGGDEWGHEGRVGAVSQPEGHGVGGALIGDRRAFEAMGGYGHRFHENVLSALDSNMGNPFHEMLGTGQVREFIGVAKEFRNRWKDIDESTGSINGEELQVGIDRKLKRYEKTLKDLNLDVMLGSILEALERARVTGEEVLIREGGIVQHGGLMDQTGSMLEPDMTDAPFEAGGDAMEWE